MSEDIDKNHIEKLYKYANSPVSSVREIAAEDPDTPAELLIKLAKDEDELVVYDVATNPSTPKDILEDFSINASSFVKLGLLQNEKISDEILQRLKKDKDESIAYAAEEFEKDKQDN